MVKEKTLTVALYIRVSTLDQVVNGYSMQQQEEELRNYAKNMGHRVVEEYIYREEGESGANDDRPKLKQLMQDARKGYFDCVLVWKIDRWARRILFLFQTVEELERYNVGFKSITQPFDTTGSFGKAILGILGVMAELERNLIMERTQLGKIRSMKEGRWMGQEPFGYIKNKDKQLIINESEAETVKMIFRMCAKEGKTLFAIQSFLNANKIPTQIDNLQKLNPQRKNRRTANGEGFWHMKTIYTMLVNATYTGVYYANRFITAKKGTEQKERPQEEWIKITMPPIVSESLFKQAQAVLKENKELSRKKTKTGVRYMLSHLIECGQCGGKYVVWGSTKGTKNYRCNRRNSTKAENPCTASSISAIKIESAVWEKVAELLKNPDFLLDEIKKHYESKDDTQELHKEISLKMKEIETIERRDRELLKCIGLEGFDTQDIQIEIAENSLRKRRIQDDVSILQNRLFSDEDRQAQLQAIQSLVKSIQKNIDTLDYDEKCDLVRLLIEKVVIKDDVTEIHTIIPPLPQNNDEENDDNDTPPSGSHISKLKEIEKQLEQKGQKLFNNLDVLYGAFHQNYCDHHYYSSFFVNATYRK